MRLVEILTDGTSTPRELAPHETHAIEGEYSVIRSADLDRSLHLRNIAQIFINGVEIWRSAVPEVATAVEQGRTHTIVASDEVRLRDQAG